MKQLTDREKEIYRLVVQGEKTSVISLLLFIEEATVKYHKTNIYKKLNVCRLPGLLNRHFKLGQMGLDPLKRHDIEPRLSLIPYQPKKTAEAIIAYEHTQG
jgi:DNA-binding CsgD family transcriptional regulator